MNVRLHMSPNTNQINMQINYRNNSNCLTKIENKTHKKYPFDGDTCSHKKHLNFWRITRNKKNPNKNDGEQQIKKKYAYNVSCIDYLCLDTIHNVALQLFVSISHNIFNFLCSIFYRFEYPTAQTVSCT